MKVMVNINGFVELCIGLVRSDVLLLVKKASDSISLLVSPSEERVAKYCSVTL